MPIRDPRELADLCARLRAAGSFAIDTEFIRESTFRPRLCLVQLALPGEVWAVDPLAIDDLGPLVGLVSDPGVEKVVHAGHQDMEIFFVLSGDVPRRVFDTQVAAALLGRGEGIGYSRLVEQELGVQLAKGETFTDWAERPLRPEQVEYALDDVRHLPALRERMGAELEAAGRTEWLREECAAYESPDRYTRDPRDAWRRVKGAGRLSPADLAVLRELAAWRESEAVRRDRPRGRILSDSSLVELARHPPEDLDGLRRLRGVSQGLVRRAGKSILAAIERGRACPPWDRPPRPERRDKDPRAALVVDLLEVLLRRRAHEHRIAPGYLASRSELFDLLESVRTGAEPAASRLLEGWRRGIAGDELLALLRGERRLRIDPQSLRVAVEE